LSKARGKSCGSNHCRWRCRHTRCCSCHSRSLRFYCTLRQCYLRNPRETPDCRPAMSGALWSRFSNIDLFRRLNGCRCYRMGQLTMLGSGESAASNSLAPASQKDPRLQRVTEAWNVEASCPRHHVKQRNLLNGNGAVHSEAHQNSLGYRSKESGTCRPSRGWLATQDGISSQF
jgi:hypothetical protein